MQSPKITKELKEDILEYYGQAFPNTAKPPTAVGIGKKIRQMYKSRGKDRIDRQLRTKVEDIFILVEPDYR